MPPLTTFCWGFAGSVAVEIVTMLGFYSTRPNKLPRQYRRLGFWATRFSLALLGGALAVGYGIEQAILAFNIGAATPVIITSLARGVRPPGSPPRSLRPGHSARAQVEGEPRPSSTSRV